MEPNYSNGSNPHTGCICSQITHADHPLICQHCKRSLTMSDDLQKQLALLAAENKRLKESLHNRDDALRSLQQDMQYLNQKYVAEIDRVAEVQHEKDLVEHELEELSCKLFEEANGMVAEEKRGKWHLENQLRQAEEQLKAEQNQLSELRLRMQEFTAAEGEDNKPDDPHTRARFDLEALCGIKRSSTNNVYRRQVPDPRYPQQRTLSMPTISSLPKPLRTSTIDEIQLEAFREFVQLSPDVTPKKMNHLNQFAYMKHCLAEDVELCLRFGPRSRVPVKKLIESLSRQPCFIEPISEEEQVQMYSSAPASVTHRQLWSKTPSGGGLGCAACGRRADAGHPLTYRFRLCENEAWSPIDQFCRDRLVAVCEFFVFIRNIRLKLYADRSIDDLYTENIRLRLQMFYSRMGALPVILDDIGVEPDTFGRASSPTEVLATIMDDPYISDCSASTSGPHTPTMAYTPSKIT